MTYLITYEGEPRALGGVPFSTTSPLLVDPTLLARDAFDGTERQYLDWFVGRYSDTQDPPHWTLTAYSFKSIEDAQKAMIAAADGKSNPYSSGTEVKLKTPTPADTPNVPPSPYPAGGVPLNVTSPDSTASTDVALAVGEQRNATGDAVGKET